MTPTSMTFMVRSQVNRSSNSQFLNIENRKTVTTNMICPDSPAIIIGQD